MPARLGISFPDRKISVTFLAFAEPIIAPSGAGESDAGQREALKCAWMVWNAVVMADVAGDSGLLAKIRGLVKTDPGPSSVVETLIARKRNLFGGDQRLIGDWTITQAPDGPRLRAEARSPLYRDATKGVSSDRA